MTTADVNDILIHYVEWLNTTALGTNAIIGASDITTFFLGNYVATDGIWFNPAVQSTITLTAEQIKAWDFATVTAYQNWTPIGQVGGSIGTIHYYPGQAGYQMETQTAEVDSGYVFANHAAQLAIYNDFNTKKMASNALVTAYNDAKAAETARMADAIKAVFDPKIVIPARPCPPTVPQATIETAKLDIAAVRTTAFQNTQAAQKNVGALKVVVNSVTGYAGTDKFQTRSGYLVATGNAGATATFEYTGHVFGVLGQGMGTMYSKGAMPFVYMTPAATDRAGIQLSIFPANLATTDLAASKKIEFNLVGKAWAGNDKW